MAFETSTLDNERVQVKVETGGRDNRGGLHLEEAPCFEERADGSESSRSFRQVLSHATSEQAKVLSRRVRYGVHRHVPMHDAPIPERAVNGTALDDHEVERIWRRRPGELDSTCA
jgi:hypothetical protein